MIEARYYEKLSDRRLRCDLCPHGCLLKAGSAGLCRVRKNNDGILVSEVYGVLSGFQMDPIEKKPLNRFFPGSDILSIGAFGCNFRCPWCQNASISQCGSSSYRTGKSYTPEEVLLAAGRSQSIGVAYTYNEPTVWYEFMMDAAIQVKEAGMQNVVVTNGYINPKPLAELLNVAHAFNVDLKGYSDDVYRQYAGGRLSPVLDTLRAIVDKGVHLEITFLVVPGVNDNLAMFKEMITWIRDYLGSEVPLHINRYFPSWQMDRSPTSISLLKEMRVLARTCLDYVYLGNVPG